MNANEEVIYNNGCVISDLKSQIAQLNKEANWLVTHMLGGGFCPPNMNDCTDVEITNCTRREAIDCWKHAAKKAVAE